MNTVPFFLIEIGLIFDQEERKFYQIESFSIYAMYEARNTGKEIGVRRTQRTEEMLYSREYHKLFWGMSSNILQNIAKHSGECLQTCREWHQTCWGMLLRISGDVAKHSGECYQTFRGISPITPRNALKHLLLLADYSVWRLNDLGLIDFK